MISFEKYEGAGNDFILINDTGNHLQFHEQEIKKICDRRFGIGADGLMLLRLEAGYDFRMVYYNSDGRESSMCGNGGRCISSFAMRQGICGHTARFLAFDGPHLAEIEKGSGAADRVSISMKKVSGLGISGQDFIADTGSPHYLRFVDDARATNVFEEGRMIRQSAPYKNDGINVNFISQTADGIFVRTYERGVEDETLSCGTGVTAAALAWAEASGQTSGVVKVETRGGILQVSFKKDSSGGFSDIWLTGPATYVFKGSFDK